MKSIAAVAVLMFAALPVFAQEAKPAADAKPTGPKPCEELKTEIAGRLDAKGVKGYTLDIVAKDKEAPGKVVGTCGGGTQKIMYTRGTASAAPATTESKPKE
jgi:hypothetical protein